MKIILSLFLVCFFVYGADYSSMSLEEMQAMRGSVAEADRDSFKTQMQSKMQSLSPQDREEARSAMRQNISGSQMRRDGSQNGSMNRYRRGR